MVVAGGVRWQWVVVDGGVSSVMATDDGRRCRVAAMHVCVPRACVGENGCRRRGMLVMCHPNRRVS